MPPKTLTRETMKSIIERGAQCRKIFGNTHPRFGWTEYVMSWQGKKAVYRFTASNLNWQLTYFEGA